jgi:hypothetical protein
VRAKLCCLRIRNFSDRLFWTTLAKIRLPEKGVIS